MSAPKTFTVTFLDDTEPINFNIIHADRIAAEMEGYRRGWGKIEETPISWLSMWTHKATRRLRPDIIPDRYDDFVAMVADIVADDDPEEETDPFSPDRASDPQ